MKKELQEQEPDTCGGVPRPAGTKDYICENDKWVEVEIPTAPKAGE